MTQTTPETYDQAIARLRTAAARAGTEDEARAVADRIRDWVRRQKAAQWEPYPWQHPHRHPEGWISERAPGVCDERCHLLPTVTIPAQGAWLEYGGRGTGKTEGAAHYVNRHVEAGPCDHRLRGGHKMLIIGPTQGDAIDAAVTGVSGLETINPAVRHVTRLGGTFVIWPNGARARILGASTEEDVKSLRASGNNCLIYLEEAAAMRRLRDVIDIATFGLRTGPNAHWVMATTPKNRPELKALSADPLTVVTRGRTRDATRLNPADRAVWEAKYGGTTMGRQELDAEELGDVEGALWVSDRPLIVNGQPNPDERPGIANDRILDVNTVAWTPHGRPTLHPVAGVDGLPPVLAVPPQGASINLETTIVAVDPAGGSTENGIIVAGRLNQVSYVLADLSLTGPPDTWARVLLAAYYDYGCTGIAAETTYGGDQVPSVIRLVCQSLGIPVPPIFRMPTKVGKKLRAEPVVALYQQHRARHVGVHALLEGEQTGWVPEETKESPNRLDALVHAETFLLVSGGQVEISNPARAQGLPQIGSVGRR